MTPQPRQIRLRAVWLLGAFAAATAALSTRLVVLQVLDAPKLSAMAEAQRTKSVDLSAVRGEIDDRNEKPLAVSEDSYSVYAQPADFRNTPVAEVAARLGPIVGQTPEALLPQLRGTHFRWIKRQMDPPVRDALRKRPIPGVGYVREPRRVYPKGKLAATLLGFVGVDNKGLAGVECSFDRELRGPNQRLAVQVDAYGRELLRENGLSPLETMATEGTKIVLTIDENLQHIAERELAAQIEESGSLRGAALMMEPQTGNILACAILPTYDPNHYDKVQWQTIKNWAVTDVYEPGSTMKMFTIAAGLEMRKITPTTVFDIPPYIRVQGRVITDHDAPNHHRALTPISIMEVSSNVGTTMIGLRMKNTEHRHFLTHLGFGRRSGSGFLGESRGLVPLDPWKPLTQATISFGQGISVTALQLLAAASAIGNGGIKMQPRFIDRIENAKGVETHRFPLKREGKVMSPETARMVMAMLEQVCKTGTAKDVHVDGYRVGGKTGTAQKIRDDGRAYSSNVMSSFLGFAPTVNPRFCLLVVLDSPQKIHWAASTAVPTWGKIAKDALRYLGVQPTEPVPSPSMPPRHAEGRKAEHTPEVHESRPAEGPGSALHPRGVLTVPMIPPVQRVPAHAAPADGVPTGEPNPGPDREDDTDALR